MKKLLKAVAITTLIPVLIHVYMYVMFSHLRVYERIQLGSRRADALSELIRDGVYCSEFVEKTSEPSVAFRNCMYTDPWREYQVAFTFDSQLLVRKSVRYMRPHVAPRPILLRITAWIFDRRSLNE